MKNNIFLLFAFYLLLSTSLYAVEGNDPIPKLELPLPEVFAETLKVEQLSHQSNIFALLQKKSSLSFPNLFLGLKIGKNELGKDYNIKISGSTNFNNLLALQILEIEDKISIGVETELRTIGNKSILEINAKTKKYRIGEKYWKDLYLANSSISLYLGGNVFKILVSGCYELEPLWDIGVLWGRRFWEPLFIGVGVSAPIVTPFVQMNWRVNELLSINISHRSKKVTKSFESIYMNQPYVVQNSDLKHEQWNSFSTVKFLLGDNVTLELSHKWVENIIYWDHPFPMQARSLFESIIPVNGKQQKKWEGGISLEWQKIKNVISFEYIPLEVYSDSELPKCIILSYLPTVLFINTLEIPLPYDVEIGLESKYIEKNIYYRETSLGTFSTYWLFSLGLSKRLKNWEVLFRINNLTNTEYQVIRGVEGPDRSIQAGFNIKL